jgi:hypothetical protein
MISIVVCSHRPANAERIRAHLAAVFAHAPHELVLIDDAVSLCEGYTRGLRQTRGEWLVFSHDDVEFIGADAAARLLGHLASYDVVGVAGTTHLIDGAWASAGDPSCFGFVVYPAQDGRFTAKLWGAGDLCVGGAQALDGCLMACRREVAERVGFDAETFDGFHLYDLDFTFRAHRQGFRLAVCRDLALIHDSTGTVDASWRVYKRRFEEKFRDCLESGVPGPIREIRATLPKNELAWFCAPEGIQTLLRKLA